eukprot:3545163-Pyramimonas_sp.AAC.1
MERCPYALVTLLATGAPWGEQGEGKDFEEFMVNTFGASLLDGVPSGSQDAEFGCAHPARNGSNYLLKGRAACQFPDAVETPRAILA